MITSVLIVDDEVPFLDLEERILTQDSDIRVFRAQSVNEAMEFLHREHIDVIISDYEMPEINGIEFLISLRQQEIDTPFIILTGKGMERVAIKAMTYGVDYYMRKGEDPRVLFEDIKGKIRTVMLERARRQMLEEKAEQYQKFFNTIPLPCLIIDESGRILDANQALCDLFGYSRDELNLSSTLFPEKNQIQVALPFGTGTADGQRERSPSLERTGYLQKKNGTRFKAEITIVPYSLHNQDISSIIIKEIPPHPL